MACLAALAFVTWELFEASSSPGTGLSQLAQPSQQLLSAAPRVGAAFNPQEVPPWLFVHVVAIAALQVVAVLFAGFRASRQTLLRRDRAAIQFLIEIPMYLGLFGTLLGVCLTQFITGTLVAPLAYLTTMSGIALHVFGKLMILLPVAGEDFEES